MGLAAALVLFGQLAQADAARALELSAAAAGSPRLPDCALTGNAGELGAGLWQRAGAPALQRYCDLLATGYASLNDAPDRALAAAQQALGLIPERRGARLLCARARVALELHAEAYADFVAIGAPADLTLPDALHDFALSAAVSGEHERAATAYRLLVSRVGLLTSLVRRQRVLVEAGIASMQLGSSGVDDAIATLKEARQLTPAPGLLAHVGGALVLALDRRGQVAQARGMAAEITSWSALERALEQPGLAPSQSRSRRRAQRLAWPRLPAAELHAMLAVLLEERDPESAREHWAEFLDDPAAAKGPWVAHARQKLAELTTGRRKGR